MKNILLLGNGLNRCYEHTISWNALMDEVAMPYQVTIDTELSFPIQFEVLMNTILKLEVSPSPKMYSEIKSQIASKIKTFNVEDPCIHDQYLDLNWPILTTNYDYTLEKRLENRYRNVVKVNFSDETKYSINRYYQIDHHRVYHIHGELNKVGSICLGYEHYIAATQKMRETLKKSNFKDILLNISQLSTIDSFKESWLFLCFSAHVHIIGFLLDENEVDLWWLFIYRASLYYANVDGFKDLIQNQVYYSEVIIKGNPLNDKNRKRLDLLKSLHIHVIEIEANTYLEGYQLIINYLNKENDNSANL